LVILLATGLAVHALGRKRIEVRRLPSHLQIPRPA